MKAAHLLRPVRRLRDRLRSRAPRSEDVPLVSVVVPFYGVEDYIRECLDSVAAQDLDDMEVLLVDDGSRDGSRAIAEEFVRADPRFRLLTRPNGGLGAARNTGVREARGRYLTFVDSDDRLAPRALRMLVDSLAGSGSDIAVGAVERFDRTRTWTSPWVRDVHARRRTGVTAEEFPALLRNFYTWNKLFRRDFFVQQGLWFREGVAYEDQPIITQLLARARSVDVLPEVVYHYRAREDQSSISQQSATLADLRARLEAWRLTREAIAVELPATLHHAWLQTLFDAHFGWYLGSEGIADDTYWAELREAVVQYAAEAPESVWEAAPPPRRVLVALTMADRREDVRTFVDRGGLHLDRWPTRPEPDGVLVDLPLLGDPGLDRSLFLLHRSQWQVAHAIEQLHRVEGPDGPAVRIAGWAHLDGIDQTGWGTDVTFVLRSRRSGDEVVHPARRDVHPVTAQPSQRAGVDAATGAFSAEVPLTDLARRSDDGEEWEVVLRLHAGDGAIEAPVTVVRRAGSPGSPLFAHAGGTTLAAHWRPGTPLLLRARAAGACLADVTTEDRRLHGRLADPPAAGTRLVATGGEPAADHEAPVEPDGALRLDLPPAGDLPPGRPRDWRLSLAGPAGSVPLGAPWPSPLPAAGSRVAPVPTPDGALLLREWSLAAVADEVEVEADGAITVHGRVLGPPETRVRLSVGDDDRAAVDPSVPCSDGRFTVRGRLEIACFRFGPRPFPVGHHELGVVVTVEGQETRLPLLASEALATSLPQPVATPRHQGRLVRGLRDHLRLVLLPPIGDARGARAQRHLRARFRVQEQLEEIVLLRAGAGHTADGDARALHHELRRRTDVRVRWAVEDHAVLLPEGAEPVVVNSHAWYDTLARARYVVSDSVMPAFFAPSPDQVLLRVWSGHPGMLDDVGPDHDPTPWDHVLAPSPLLVRWLRSRRPDWDLLDVGSPRNDLLGAPDPGALRQRVRADLGADEDDVVVHLAPGSWSGAPDGPDLARRLGPGYLVLADGEPGPGYLDVRDYPVRSELHLAADVAVTGDLAEAVDHAAAGTPLVRPLTADDPDVPLPGERVDSLPALVAAVVRTGSGEATDAERFRREYLGPEDGRASARVVDTLVREGGR